MNPEPTNKPRTPEEMLEEFEDEEDTITKYISEINEAAGKLTEAATQVEQSAERLKKTASKSLRPPSSPDLPTPGKTS
jgi:prefoldin subunit 5